MSTYTASQIEKATGVSGGDVANWSKRGLLNIPFAVPGRGKARRYSTANAYEFALIRALSQAGVALEKASKLLHDRLLFIAEERASDLNESFPGMEAFNHDRWLGLDFDREQRQKDGAVFYVLEKMERLPTKPFRLIGMSAKGLANFLKKARNAVNPVVNVTMLLDRVDGVLADSTIAPKAASRVEPKLTTHSRSG